MEDEEAYYVESLNEQLDKYCRENTRIEDVMKNCIDFYQFFWKTIITTIPKTYAFHLDAFDVATDLAFGLDERLPGYGDVRGDVFSRLKPIIHELNQSN